MNLDLAIQNTLRRSPMDSAMHGVLSDFGGQYELKSFTENGSLQQRLFGDSVGISAPIGSENLAKPVLHAEREVVGLQPAVSQNLSYGLRTFKLTYEPSNQRWTLIEYIPESGFNGFINKLMGRPNGGREEVLAVKMGTAATHRFLTEVETSVLPEDIKREIASIGVMSMRPVVSAVSQSLRTDSFDDSIDIAGTAPISAQSFNQSNVMEMDLAAEYRGVKKLKSNHFMGDTIIPTPMSHIHAGAFRSAESFNQNPVGSHVAPPTKVAGGNRKYSRSL